MFGGIGGGELLIIFVFALIFIGPKKLPELAKGLGRALREFQKAKNDMMDSINSENNTTGDKPKETATVTEASSEQSTHDQTNKPT